MADSKMLPKIERVLNILIDDMFKDVPFEHKTDFAKKMDCPTRTVALNAMEEWGKYMSEMGYFAGYTKSISEMEESEDDE